MESLLPNRVCQWVRAADSLHGGDGLNSDSSTTVWERVLSGVFISRVLAKLCEHEAEPKGLLIHARSENACFYNWTRVVFPQLLDKEDVISLTPSVKSGVLAGNHKVLAHVVQQLYDKLHDKSRRTKLQKGYGYEKVIVEKPKRNFPESDPPESVSASLSSIVPGPRRSRLDRLNRMRARIRKREATERMLLETLASTSITKSSPVALRPVNPEGRANFIPDDIAYVTDREVDELDASVKELLRLSRAEHENNYEQKHGVTRSRSQADSRVRYSLPKRNSKPAEQVIHRGNSKSSVQKLETSNKSTSNHSGKMPSLKGNQTKAKISNHDVLKQAQGKLSLLPRVVHRSQSNTKISRTPSKELVAMLDFVEKTERDKTTKEPRLVGSLILKQSEGIRTSVDQSIRSKSREIEAGNVGPWPAGQRSRPTHLQMLNLQEEMKVLPLDEESANRIVSWASEAFAMLQYMFQLPLQPKKTLQPPNISGSDHINHGISNDGSEDVRSLNTMSTSEDAFELFGALVDLLIFYRINTDSSVQSASAELVRSHLAMNMTLLLQQNVLKSKNSDNRQYSRVVKKKHQFRKSTIGLLVPLDELMENLCNAIVSNRDQWWKTLGEDLRLIDTMLHHPSLSLSSILVACDLLSELWLTEEQWCLPAGSILEVTVNKYLPFRTMRSWALRLVNVSLGIYIKDAKHILLRGEAACRGKSFVADSRGDFFSKRQLRILEFLVRIVFGAESGTVKCQKEGSFQKGMKKSKQPLGISIRKNIVAVVMPTLSTLENLCREHQQGLAQELKAMGCLNLIEEVDAVDFLAGIPNGNRPGFLKRFEEIASSLTMEGEKVMSGTMLMKILSEEIESIHDNSDSEAISDIETPLLTPLNTPTRSFYSSKGVIEGLDRNLLDHKSMDLSVGSMPLKERRMQMKSCLMEYFAMSKSPSFKLAYESGKIDTELFHEFLLEGLPGDSSVTYDDAKRILTYIDSKGTGSVSIEEIASFMASGLTLSPDKRLVYSKKSATHSTIMKFLEEMWSRSISAQSNLWSLNVDAS